MKLAIGCDEAAYRLKTIIMEHLEEKHPEIEVADFGAAQGDTVLYPDVAYTVADAVASGEFQRGILLCGTGIWYVHLCKQGAGDPCGSVP